MKPSHASFILGYSLTHIYRLKKKLLFSGISGIIRKYSHSPKKIPPSIKNNIVSLYKKYYFDFNIMHFKDKLSESHDIHLSYETTKKF